MACQALQGVARGWDPHEEIRIVQGIRFHPFSADFGAWGIGAVPFSYFGGVPFGALLFSVLYPYSTSVAVLCCVHIFVPCGWKLAEIM